MLFNSFEFLIFLFTLLIFFYPLRLKESPKYLKTLLLISSFVYYAWWDIPYFSILLFSLIFNFNFGEFIHKNKKRYKERKILNLLMWLGISVNLGILGYFKYRDFFFKNINFIFDSNFSYLNLAIPLGLSFFTFQQIGYIVDCAKEEHQSYNPLNYFLFVSFFPQLIAGPIVYHKELVPQFRNFSEKLNWDYIYQGVFLFNIGLFKKLVLADSLASWANYGFDQLSNPGYFDAWVSSLSYTFQLYFDFSGYTDMATGVALFFNIKLPVNFDSPYQSLNIQLFWRKWHATLGAFLRDYVYIPLGGSRKQGIRTYFNLIFTFILGGIWHGAGYTFIIWGALHGLALAIHRYFSSLNIELNKYFSGLITFFFVNFAWIFFRAKDLSVAYKIIRAQFFGQISTLVQIEGPRIVNSPGGIHGDIKITFLILFSFILTLCFRNSIYFSKNLKHNYFYAFFVTILILTNLIYLNSNFSQDFLYYDF